MLKDVACNTDHENKENIEKCLTAHKKIQVSMLRKKKLVKPSSSSSATQTLEVVTSVSSGSNKNSTTLGTLSTPSGNTCMTLIPFSENNVVCSNIVEPIQTTSDAVTSLSSSMRITPALISTPIMTPSLFISNYPIVVSQIPQSVLIVKNTEINTTVNKVVPVKSKTINGRVPLPPLKKSIAIKKPPRKKRILKKKIKEVQNSNMDNENFKIESGENKNQDMEKSAAIINETVIPLNKSVDIAHEKDTISEKSESKNAPTTSKENEQNGQKQLQDLSSTPLLIPSGKLLDRLDSSSSLLNLESHRKSFSPVSQDISHMNDSSAISNLDIESFSLLTANILSGIDANDTSENNLSSNLGKMLDVKDVTDCTTKTSSLATIPSDGMSSGHIECKEKPVDKPVGTENRANEATLTRPRETIQVRKGLLQIESKLSTMQNVPGRQDTTGQTSSNSTYNCSTSLVVPSQSNNYPNFSLSLSQDVRSKPKPVTDVTSVVLPKPDVSTTYTMNGPTYSTNLNYTGYYCNSNNAHTSLQQLYSNQHSNNIIPANYSKPYDSQRSYYADQPSTNFTFSLTSASKSHAKYVSSGTKSQSQNMNHTQLSNVQETCKKFNSKSVGYNYTGDNVKSVTSHSIARLNSKYDNHKENDTPFYLSQDTACKKVNAVQKVPYNQPSFANNSSCARYPQHQQLQAPTKQSSTNKNVKSSSLTTHQPQMSSRYDIDWMSSSEIKPSTNDFQLFPSLESSPMNQNSYYSSTISNFDINRKTSDLYFAHPPGEENLPWSPSRMSNILDAPHMSGNQCFSTTLPNLHGDLALNTLSTGGHSRSSSILETPTKAGTSSYNSAYPAVKEPKKVSHAIDSQQNNSFSVRQLVDMNQSSKTSLPSDKMSNLKRKSSSQKENDGEDFSSDIIPYENQKPNSYSAESLINPRHNSKSKSWHTETGHPMSTNEPNQNNSLFTMESTGENQNYTIARYEPKFFNQNYVPPLIDNSFSNAPQNFHNFSKSQPFTFGESNNPTIDYHQSSLGNTMSTFLSHHDTPEKLTQHYYPQSSKAINPINMDSTSSRNNQVSSAVAAPSHSNKKPKSSHHVPTTTHHSLIMNYDFPVTPVTPSLSYFSTHDWKSTPTEPYPAMHHNPCNSNSYVNSSNFYSQNILQNSQTQNLATGLSSNNLSNNSHSQNTSNSLTNFNLSTICPEINDKVRHQHW